MSQIYYELDCSALMCFIQVRINDVEVFSLNVDGQAAMDIPINHGVLESGSHDIEVRVLPLNGTTQLHKEASVRYRVNEFDVSSGDFKFIKQFENHETQPVKEGIPVVIHRSKFNANVSYKIEAWQNAVNLKDANHDLKPKLINEYNKIANFINNGNYDSFMNAFAQKEENTSVVMYLNKEEKASRMKKLINDFSSGFKAKLFSNDAIIDYMAFGKLASLKRGDGSFGLFLENLETNEEMILPFSFYMPKGSDKFEIV